MNNKEKAAELREKAEVVTIKGNAALKDLADFGVLPIDEHARLKQSFKDLAAKLLKEAEELEAQPERWEPKDGEAYFSLSDDGKIFPGQKGKADFHADRIVIGNCFRTREEAEARRDFMLLLTDNNLWERLQEEVTLRLELEAFASRFHLPLDQVYNAIEQEKDTDLVSFRVLSANFHIPRLNILFQPLKP